MHVTALLCQQVMLIDNYLTGTLPAGSASTPELAGLDFAVNRHHEVEQDLRQE